MKKKQNFFDVLIILILIGVITFIGYIIYYKYLKKSSSDIEEIGYPTIDYSQIENNYKKEDDNTDIVINIDDESDSVTKEKIEGKSLYLQLSDEAKIIYEKLYKNKENLKTGNYIIQFNTSFNYLFKQNEEETAYNILKVAYQAAIEAFIYENPDVFYLDVTKMYINFERKSQMNKVQYNIYISDYEETGYLAEGFTSKEEIDICEAKLELLKDTITKTISNKNDIDKLKYIHNYIVDNISYDITVSKPNIYNIYGALILQECVCEGYAKAFQYLANAVGIENIIVNGNATNSLGNTEKHAWNYIKLDNAWYAIDTTWDDPVIEGGGNLTDRIRYQYFLKGSNTMNKNHYPSKKFTDDSVEFELPTLSVNDYKY